MAAVTTGAHRSYARNVVSAAHEFFAALFARKHMPSAQQGTGLEDSTPHTASALVPYYRWSHGVELGDHAD